jgi:hypothetical protein
MFIKVAPIGPVLAADKGRARPFHRGNIFGPGDLVVRLERCRAFIGNG